MATESIAVPPRVSQFVERLKELERGDLAVLRRNAGRSLADSRGAFGVFFRLLPADLGWREEIFFLVATLYALNPVESTVGDFGKSLALAKDGTDGGGLDRRVAVLLDSDYEWLENGRFRSGELGFRLRQAVKYLKSKDIGVEWGLLLYHLLNWSHPDRWVQRTWARSYYGKTQIEDEAQQKEEN